MARSFSTLLLRPAVAVLARLRLAPKLVLIALVLIAPALYATWQFRTQQNAQIAFSSKERIGVEEIVPAGRLLTELANARALGVRSAGGDADATAALPTARTSVAHAVAALDAADRRLGSDLGTVNQWRALRTSIQATVAARPTDARTALDAYDRLTAATLALIVQAGNEPNLILDPTSTRTTRWTRWSTRSRWRWTRPGASPVARSRWSPPGRAPRRSASRWPSTRA